MLCLAGDRSNVGDTVGWTSRVNNSIVRVSVLALVW